MAERVVGESTSLAERKRRAGQRLVIGFAGPAVDDGLRALVREIRPGGFCLFRRNVVDPAQVRELNRELATLGDPAPLRTVDQEGGRVQRVREPATPWPPMRSLGARSKHVAAVSTAMATELRAMGFDLNFAPVADVDSNPDNPVIGDRSFGNDPDEVAERVVAFALAHQAAGVMACAKHFPGHGDTSVDSHLDLPTVTRSEASLRATELVPFARAVSAGVASVMSSHVVFPALDRELPATLSPVVIPKLLRGELGFDGVVFSDDMEMKAVADRWPVPDQVELGSRAGVDVFLVCEHADLQARFFEALVAAQERDPGQHRAAARAVERLDALRARFRAAPGPTPDLDVVGRVEHRVLAELARGTA